MLFLFQIIHYLRDLKYKVYAVSPSMSFKYIPANKSTSHLETITDDLANNKGAGLAEREGLRFILLPPTQFTKDHFKFEGAALVMLEKGIPPPNSP